MKTTIAGLPPVRDGVRSAGLGSDITGVLMTIGGIALLIDAVCKLLLR